MQFRVDHKDKLRTSLFVPSISLCFHVCFAMLLFNVNSFISLFLSCSLTISFSQTHLVSSHLPPGISRPINDSPSLSSHSLPHSLITKDSLFNVSVAQVDPDSRDRFLLPGFIAACRKAMQALFACFACDHEEEEVVNLFND